MKAEIAAAEKNFHHNGNGMIYNMIRPINQGVTNIPVSMLGKSLSGVSRPTGKMALLETYAKASSS